MTTARDEQVARAVEGIDGVVSATVQLPGGVGRGQLRVVFEPGRPRDRVAADVAGMLQDRFGLHIDPEAIARLGEVGQPVESGRPPGGEEIAPPAADDVSGVPPAADEVAGEPPPDEVAPAEAPEEAPGAGTGPSGPGEGILGEVGGTVAAPMTLAARRPRRPLIRRIEVGGAGLEVRARATLWLDGRTVLGEATAAATPAGRLRSAAQATLRALEQLLGGDTRLELDELDVEGDGQVQRVVARVGVLTWTGLESHVGVALVREGDPEHATVRATLDALNRRVAHLAAEPASP